MLTAEKCTVNPNNAVKFDTTPIRILIVKFDSEDRRISVYFNWEHRIEDQYISELSLPTDPSRALRTNQYIYRIAAIVFCFNMVHVLLFVGRTLYMGFTVMITLRPRWLLIGMLIASPIFFEEERQRRRSTNSGAIILMLALVCAPRIFLY